MRIWDAAQRREVPWKNGRGTTTELAVWPEGGSLGAGFVWRLSSAAVVEDGPFSRFPGVDRLLVLLDDGELRLALPDGERVLDRRHAMARFPGDAATEGRVPRGPVRDLNLMVDRGRAAIGEARVVSRPTEVGPGLLVVLEGALALGGASLAPLEAAWLDAAQVATGEATVLLVDLTVRA
ncbi:MAG: HutD family protein [Alphaproteobacteria bacterium]|nr:HutD family protein [Alphaproteobacteria bacterium]